MWSLQSLTQVFSCVLCREGVHYHQLICEDCTQGLYHCLQPRLQEPELLDGYLKVYTVGTYAASWAKLLKILKSQPTGSFGAAHFYLLAQLADWWATELAPNEYDYVTTIPGHPIRTLLQTDLAAFYAVELAKALGIPVMTGLIKRKWTSRQQKSLKLPERLELAGDNFYLPRNERVQGARILLVDDISASGASLLTSAELLYRGGAEEVDAIVLARKTIDA